ncbi:hypothetical protein BDF22DRAFT_696820 [Syncephalis plumigaleata]|nr:hypothetical protein BDF22DRAFT_696820 [Syncephalis plumigaleata]
MTKRRRTTNYNAARTTDTVNSRTNNTSKLCQVCEQVEAKYKCPTCYLAFCSVACSRKHKETPCQKPESPKMPFEHSVTSSEQANETDIAFPLDQEQLVKIDNDATLQQQLQHSRLKTTIQYILGHTELAERDKVLEQLLASDDDFRTFTNQLLEVVGYEDTDADRALKKMQALERQRIQTVLQEATSAQSDDEVDV